MSRKIKTLKIYSRECIICGKVFTSRRITGLVCGRWQCKKEHKNRREKIRGRRSVKKYNLTCLNCNKIFSTTREYQKFCNEKCRRDFGRKERLKLGISKEYIKECPTCKKQFTTTVESKIYCDPSCGQNNRRDKIPTKMQWEIICEYIMERDNYKCIDCHSDKKLLVHHKIPLCNDGTNNYDNLETLCPVCHGKKHTKLMEVTYAHNHH